MTSERQWTVLAFLAGDNNLSVSMVHDLKKMKLAGIGPDRAVTVVAQFDPAGSVVPTQRYVLTEGDEDGALPDDVCVITGGRRIRKGQSEPEIENSGNPRTLLNFLRWGMQNYPAQHYMVVLSGHGSGADENLFLRDDTSNDSLSLSEMQTVLRAVRQELGREIDVLGLDSCLMSMAEVFYQLRGTVSYVVANEGFNPNTGWPYHRILPALVADPAMSPEALARTVVERYIRYYKDFAHAGLSVDISACNVGATGVLADSVRKLTNSLKAALAEDKDSHIFKDALVMSHWEAQTYKHDQYTDLYDYCQVLISRCNNPAVTAACQEVMDIIQKRIVVKSCYCGADFQYSHGLSIYFPWSVVSGAYRELDFAQETGWHEFIEACVNATRRAPRPVSNPQAELRPAPAAFVMAAGTHRYSFPINKYSFPINKQFSVNSGSTKNQPIGYYECECCK